MTWNDESNRVLIDTHALIWNAEGKDFTGDGLSQPAIRAIDSAQIVIISYATLWELAIRCGLPGSRALQLSRPYADWINAILARSGFTILEMSVEHLKKVATLPPHHGDPFDRLLVAQSLVENIPIVSADDALDPYGIVRVW